MKFPEPDQPSQFSLPFRLLPGTHNGMAFHRFVVLLADRSEGLADNLT
ncbi:MAG: hypothetical protein HGA66_01190 [Holophaga sp.]|nr:hypothetical protein [Holophaga sp.]